MTDPDLHDRLDPASAVVAVIDVQNDFCHRDGTVAGSGLDVGAVGPAVDRIRDLLTAARRSGVPVVFVRTEHDGEVDSPSWRRRRDGGRAPGDAAPAPNCATGSWGAGFFRVEPRPGERVVTKHRYSAFSAPAFTGALYELGRRSIVFTGIATDVCVESSLRDAVDDDFLVGLASDCCAAYTEADHDSAVSRINRSFGPAFDSSEAVRRWTAAVTLEGA